MGTVRTVLIVEDEAGPREAIAALLRRRGYEVVLAADGLVAERLVAEAIPDLAVVGALLPGQSGFRVASAVKEHSEGRVPVVITSGNGSDAHRDYAFAAGADAFLAKPVVLPELLEVVAGLCPMARIASPRPVALAAAGS